MNKEGLIKPPVIFSGLILGLLLIVISAGCSSRKPSYIPVETIVYRTDTVHHSERIIERDSVSRIERIRETQLDSIAPILDSTGRMIGYDRWHIIDRSTELKEANSRLLAQIDSLKEQAIEAEKSREPYPVEVPVVTNRLYWWQKGLMGVGIIAMIGISIAVWWLIRRKK